MIRYTFFLKGKQVSTIKEIDGKIYIIVDREGIYRIEDGKPILWLKETQKIHNIYKYNERIVCLGQKQLIIYKKRKNITSSQIGKQFVYFEGYIFTNGYSFLTRCDASFKNQKSYKGHYFQGVFIKGDSLFSFDYKDLLCYDRHLDEFCVLKKDQIQKKLLVHSTYKTKTYLGTEGDGLHVYTDSGISKLIEGDHTIINKIDIENENSIWAISEGELLHYYRKKTGGFIKNKWSEVNGVPTNDLTEILYKDDMLYLGSESGLTIINKNEITTNDEFKPYIRDVIVNGKKGRNDSLLLKHTPDLKIKINFSAVNFFDTKNTTFSYELHPIQKKWTTTESGEVNLYNLEPNDYVLLLKVHNGSEEKIIKFPINILPNWWQTIWFRVLAAILIIGLIIAWLVYFSVRMGLKKRKKLTQEKQVAQLQLKALRSQMNPHFVFNSLAAIQYYINSNDLETSERYLVKFSKLIRTFFELSGKNEILIADEIMLLENYLIIEKLRFKNKFEYQINIDSLIDIKQTKIPTMLLQPIVENAINHGLFNRETPGNLWIDFLKINSKEMHVSIKDNGVGIAQTKKKEKQRKKSSRVLKERLYFLNQYGEWSIKHTTQEAFPKAEHKGNMSIFEIIKL